MSSRTGAWPPGYGLVHLAEVDSTNAEAARLAGRAQGPVWVTADRQTRARGRRGRVWSSPTGALSASLLLFPQEAPDISALRSFVAALALAQAFEAVGIPGGAIGLKWPNDVLLHGCKAAGILLESAGHGTRLDYLVIGIGINLTGDPDLSLIEPGATAPATLAQMLGRPITPGEMLLELAAAYAVWEARFADQGFAPIRAAWLARAARLGEPITARTLRDTLTGTFTTIDESGNLVLATAGGARAIPAADVFF